MRVFDGLESFQTSAARAVLTIGNFDGVHRGHARILATAHEVARSVTGEIVALTFDPHPLAILAPERVPPLLTTRDEKLALLAHAGVAATIVQPADPALLALEAEDFLASLVARVRPRALVEGPDFHFGRGRAGSTETLQHFAAHWGYEVHVVPEFHCAELGTHPTISSSSIRQALRDGRIDEANIMLGRPYRVVGTVGAGAGRGATLGFPTANLDDIVQMLPQHAVYAAVAQLADGALHAAAVNIGPQPTFDEPQTRVEAFVLDHTGDLRGQRIGLHFFARLREQLRFPDADALIHQLRADVAQARAEADRPRALERVVAIALG